jgi:hypothetical protein
MTEQTKDLTTEAKRLIDDALAEIKHQNFVEVSTMTDLLLDIRLALASEPTPQN